MSQRTNPARRAFAITPADTDLATPTRGIYVGGAGNLAVIMADDGTTVTTFPNVPAGSYLPLEIKQVRAATTATNIVGTA